MTKKIKETPQEILDELKALVDGASPSPWVLSFSLDKDWYLHDGKQEILLSDAPYDATTVNLSRKDFEFIAQSRTAMPRLIAALEKCIEQRNNAIIRSDIIKTQDELITAILSGEK